MDTLEEIITAEIREKGPLTFARFMELALYHPRLGYYGSGRAVIGKAGDFYTSPHTGPVFGRLIAESLLSMKRALGGGPCAFVEMGAGEGYLARDVIEHLNRRRPGERDGVGVVIVERSEGMRERQKTTLGKLSREVTWHGSLDGLPGALTGVFFSNELVDAVPFHRVRMDAGRLKEVYVDSAGGGFVETLGEPSSPELSRYMERLGMTLPEGVTTEVRPGACGLIGSVAGRLERGYVVTVDYGYPAWEYYRPERKGGTMMCYKGHVADEDPYKDVGEKDITAHAEFTTLSLCGQEAGLSTLLFTEQSSFLLPWAEELQRTAETSGASQEEIEKTCRGLMAVVHPELMGSAFKVLVQGKGVGAPPEFGRMRDRAGEL